MCELERSDTGSDVIFDYRSVASDRDQGRILSRKANLYAVVFRYRIGKCGGIAVGGESVCQCGAGVIWVFGMVGDEGNDRAGKARGEGVVSEESQTKGLEE